ncbi:MAG TPA: energy transducer TonB [Pyrinomonadaceae bacterium]
MRNTTLSLFAFLLILTVISLARAQDAKPAEQKSETPAATDSEKRKNEVEKLIADASKRGDKVIARCIDPAGCGMESSDQVLNLEAGRAVSLPKPAYPALARAAHVQGSVEVQVIIDEEGKVIAAAAISGHPLLQATCVKAARESLFTTTKLEGVPVKVTGMLRYNFITH